MTPSHAVGSLVSARGREWVVLPQSDEDVLMVRPLGGTEDEATGILLALEGSDVTEATFALPDPDEIGDFLSSGLLRDALQLGFRSSAGPFRSFGRVAVDPRPYQLVPLLMALKLDPVRMLIADDVGVGKTIEALLIARELLDQGDITRTAVLCSPQLAEQWQAEMADKFHIDATLVLPSTATKLERRITMRESLFDVYPHTIVSTDFIKSDRRRDDFLRAAPEFVIVDEAHTCVNADTAGGRGRHQRHELLKGLASDEARHLVLVTATPHSGKEAAFRALLSLLDERFDRFPEDLTGPENERFRRELSAHFVQRRRADIRAYLDEQTTFPTRQRAEITYTVSDPHRRLFDRALNLARETVTDESGGAHRQRVRWWSALALLRSLASSPAAAASTLRNRAAPADTTTVAEADEVGRRTVLDQAGDEAAEAIDVPPGSDYADDETPDQRHRRRLLELARDAEALAGMGDAKLQTAIGMVRELLADGFDPIVFCRFIPTAEYVAEHLRAALGAKVAVVAVTGTLPPGEREARIRELGRHDGRRVLVATDCMSEGINLQQHFDAVVHYDLSWNPTRHEQREGRADRFGQPSDTVRTITYYGTDNRIDDIVLQVLLRKHEAIRSLLGISVPVPGNSNELVEAIVEGVLLAPPEAQQLVFEELAGPQQRTLLDAWEDAAEQERRSQTMYAQERIDVDTVARELAAVRDAIGSQDRVEAFLRRAIPTYGGTVVDQRDGTVRIDLTETPVAVRGLAPTTVFDAAFRLPVANYATHVSRTHPLVERLATHVLDAAIDDQVDGVAARCGAIRTDAVAVRTTLLLVRFRFHLLSVEADVERPLLAEDAGVMAFIGAPDSAQWLDDVDAATLLAARPAANISPEQARRFVAAVTDGFGALSGALHEEAETRGERLLDAHRRVRDAARRKGVRFRVRPHLPPDLLGVYVLLPAEVARAGGREFT